MTSKEFSTSEPKDCLETIVPDGLSRSELLFRIKEELAKESDRGCALVAAAYIENELSALLKRFFVRQAATATEALFEFNGPVGTFSSKIRVSFALGLISKETQQALDLLRKIRNEFAHLHQPMTFESETVKNRITAMLPSTADSNGTCRDQFVKKLLFLAAAIHLYQSHAYHRTIPEHEHVPVRSTLEEHRLEVAARRMMAITCPEITYEQALHYVRQISEMKTPE
ncbi:MltR family transcriptional regulator [uncultured Zoogloea sp.]|uniref:MltR family transcriptional regulator n=1 Tax=uncultured Zoogloea sp. TaxID=160237 RepID=UPI0026206E83|nr:MltR family transcriptional regulator [uncultured Zoogloea sp.]